MPKRVLVYVFIMIVLWGSHSAVATLSFTSGEQVLSRHAFLFFTLVWGAAGLLLMIALTGRFRFFRRYGPKRLMSLAFAGVFGYFLYYFFLFWALDLARPVDAVIEANIVNYLFPICTMLASAAILRERLTLRGLLSAAIGFFGAYVVITGGAFTRAQLRHPWIDLLALGAGVSWGLFSALGRRRRYEPMTGTFIFITTGVVVSGCLLPFVGGRLVPKGWEIYGIFHVGLLCNTVAVMLWFAALRAGGSVLVGNLSLLTAFLSVMFIWLLVGEPIGGWSMVGLVIITAGVLLSRTRREAPETPPETPQTPA